MHCAIYFTVISIDQNFSSKKGLIHNAVNPWNCMNAMAEETYELTDEFQPLFSPAGFSIAATDAVADPAAG